MARTVTIVLTDGVHGSMTVDLIDSAGLHHDWKSLHEGGRLGIDAGVWINTVDDVPIGLYDQNGAERVADLDDLDFINAKPNDYGNGTKLWDPGTFNGDQSALNWRVIQVHG